MPTNMIAGTTSEQIEGGGTLTTIHLTEEAKRGLTVDADKFDQACNESLAYYATRGRERRHLKRMVWLEAFSMLVALFVTVVLVVQESYPIAAIWLFVVVMDGLGLATRIRKFRDFDRSDV